MSKKFLFAALVFIISIIISSFVFAEDQIKIFVNDKEITPDVSPEIINGRTMVPVRWVSEALGAEVEWKKEKSEVRIKEKEDKTKSIMYLEPEHKEKFVKEEIDLLLSPYDSSPVLRTIKSNTLVEVNEMAEVDGEHWVFVTIPVYDTPMNNRGWIKKENALPFTKDLEEEVQSDVNIKKGTTIYPVTAFEDISEISSKELTRDLRGRISERKGDFVYIFAPGGKSFWVEKRNIVYPSAD